MEYLASARAGWQTLAAGINGWIYQVPIAQFGRARRVRVRVVIGDG